jgi:hypothetical protein
LAAVAADRRCIDEYAAVRANRFTLHGRARWIRPTTLAAFSTDAAATAATVVTANPALAALGSGSCGAAGSTAIRNAGKPFGAAGVIAAAGQFHRPQNHK